MITRIKLTNWKSHLDSEITFSKGVNALIGIMGSGKSSVMQGIAYALFGTFSGLSSRKISLDDLIMEKPQPKKNASVELNFELDENKYVVKRVLEKGKGTTSAEIRKNGKLLEVNPKSVTAEVQRVLQMDYDMFQRAVYSEQNAIDYFLQVPKGKRMQQIDTMLKLDKYEKARENSVSIRNKVMDKRKEKLSVIEDMKELKFEEKMNEIKKEINGGEERISKLREKISNTDEKRKMLSEKVVTYESRQDLLNSIVKDIEVMNSKLSLISGQVEAKKSKISGMRVDKNAAKNIAKEIMVLNAKIESKETNIRVLRDRVSEKNSNISYLRSGIKDIKVKLSENKENEMEMKKLSGILGSDPEKKMESMLNNFESIRKELYTLEGEKVELEKSLMDLKKTKDVCPICDSYLKKERKQEIIEHKVGHIGEIEVKIKTARDTVSVKAKELNEFKKSMEKYKDISRCISDVENMRKKITESEDKIEMIKKEIEKVIPEIKNTESEEKELRKKLETASIERSRIDDILVERAEIEALEKESVVLKVRIKENERKRKELERKVKGIDINALRTEQQEVVGACKAAESEIKGIENSIKDRKHMLNGLKEQKETFDRYVRETEKFASVVDYVDRFVSVLRVTQDQLRDEFLRTVNNIMNEVWEELYPYSDFSEIRMAVEKDYVLQLKTSKGWVSADVVSGGERSLAALALRVAFSLAFTPNIRWLILDEPTHNLDKNAIEHFGGVLRDRMSNIIDQVFLITHEERISDYITGSTYRLERDKSVDGATKIAVN